MAKTPKRPPGRSFDWKSLDPAGELSKPYKPPVTDSKGRLRPEGYKEGNRPADKSTGRPAKDIKPGDLRSQTLENKGRTPKARPAKDVKPGSMRQKVLDELKQGPKQPRPAKDIKPGDMRSKFLERAKSGAKSVEKNAGKLGSLGRMGNLAALAGTFYFGDTFSSRTGNQANYGEKEWIADKANRGPLMKGNKKYDKKIGPERPNRAYDKKIGPERPNRTYGEKIGPEAPRGTAGTYTKSYDVKPKAAEPPKASASSAAAPKKAGDKSTQANKPKPTSVTGTPAKKMTNFERMKARQYEKEGYGGRSMTSEQAKAQAIKDRGYKAPTGRLTFGSKAKAAPEKKAATKQGSTSSFASKMQGRNVPGSPTYSPTKAKSGFKFSDIFKKL